MTRLAALAAIAALLLTVGQARAESPVLDAEFARPPDSVRPWVVGYWLDGNISKAGITADLEAMKRSGIGGFSFMDCGLGNPPGPHRFMSASWRDLFRFMLAEANRLGLQVDLNDGPGWAGSGGPWIRPEQAAQRVIVSETVVQGPASFSAPLPRPAGVSHDFYRDIAVLAYSLAGAAPTYRIAAYDSTKSFSGVRDFAGVVPWPRVIPTADRWTTVPQNQCLKSADMLDVTAHVNGGRLTWEVPPGRWLILRFGHTIANGGIRAGQPEAQGFECDKLSAAGIDAQFSGMVAKLADDVGSLSHHPLVSTHIDSWESGSGNWTADLRAQFARRRGYDLLPFLPTLDGLVVDSLEVSERFLWDFRETIAELVLENYAGRLRTLAHARGLRLSIEAYDGTVDDLRYAGRADEPMGEFWQRPIYSGSPMCDLAEEMVSAAHVYGRPVVGAEAFTAIRGDFLDYPALLKPLADWAFCTGINKLYLSEWVMQPYPRYAPGVSFLEFGSVFHRSLTWWPMAKAWNDYLARCQLLLRQGRAVADICYLAPEGAPLRFTPPVPAAQRGWIPDRPPYNYDACPPEVLLDPATHVEDGAVVLPSGSRYQIIVLPTYDAGGRPVVHLMPGADYAYRAAPLPRVETMTPPLLARLKQLAEAGATILGTRPRSSPSLVDYPHCDATVTALADAMWGTAQGFNGTGAHNLGRGRVVWGEPPEAVLRGSSLKPDCECDPDLAGKINYAHRTTSAGMEIYFLTNKTDHPVTGGVRLRVTGLAPELWWPETGTITAARFATVDDGATRLALTLQGRQSVFVVFRRPRSGDAAQGDARVVRDGEALWPSAPATAAVPTADDSFTLAAWVKPLGKIPMPQATTDGWAYHTPAPDAPGAGYQTYATQGEGRRGFAVGANGVVVYQFGNGGRLEPLLAYEHPMIPPGQSPIDFGNGIADADIPSVLVAVVYSHRVARLYLGGKEVMTSANRRFSDPVPTRWEDARPFAADLASIGEFEELAGIARRGDGTEPRPSLDFSTDEIAQSGTYVITGAGGAMRRVTVEIPPAREIAGPWQVAFGGASPRTLRFDQLQDWASRPEREIKFYSGIATYRTSFALPQPKPAPGTRTYLELGDVEVMATVTLNGKPLGPVWTTPYHLDVTDAVNWGGSNELMVEVANLWVNRLIGDAQLPPDALYAPNGGLKAWPRWILDGQRSPTGRQSFTTRLIWRAGDPLLKSGLLGPVRLVTVQKLPRFGG